MADLTNPRVIKLKGILFLILGLLSSILLLAPALSVTNVTLLAITVWSFCRFYYFAFYVIEHYVDPSFRFSGLGSLLKYLLQRRSSHGAE
jgi:hypothetical protein